MKAQIRIVNPLNNPQWDDLILSHPAYSFFHSKAWARVLFESYGYTPIYSAAFNCDRLLALMPMMELNSFLMGKKGVSLPFTDFSNPLADDSIQPQALLAQVIQYGKQFDWKSLELRLGNSFLPLTLPSLKYVGHTLNLAGTPFQIASRFRSSTKRNIKKALKRGVTVKSATSLDSVKEFYRLNCLTRKEHGLPPQPFEFFKNIYQHVFLKGFGSVILASYQGKSIAGSVFFHFGRKALFKYGASDYAYQALRGNNLVMWEAIRAYAEKGYQTLCFGRTDLESQGLLQYKAGWGTTRHLIRYYYYDFRKESFVSAPARVNELHKKILKEMPILLLKKIGNAFYRYAG